MGECLDLKLVRLKSERISDVIEEPRAADHRLNNTRVLLLDNYPGQGNCCNPGTARSYRDNSPNGDFESDCPGRSYVICATPLEASPVTATAAPAAATAAQATRLCHRDTLQLLEALKEN
ncbi:hypothetical protein HZH68_007171 [Vespula germanica]|uniref:Uncharacterized protein n=1 Tax=Vespula germanica TaxID=30212 RepID=A0A834K8W4_VESGE|nr:hypothetical protein HZH68_007171 [Vespula germanica]